MLYRPIADRIAQEILRSHTPGQPLMGVRDLARKEGISLLTARNVYLDLQKRGLITMRQGVGTFVEKKESTGIIDMSGIRPPGELLLWTNSFLTKINDGLVAYDPPEGYSPLRRQAGIYLEALGIKGLPLVMAGSQQALFLAGLAVLKPGDYVAVEDPGYTGALRIFESMGARIIRTPYPGNSEALQRLKDKRIRLFYTMPQAHIPTGASMPQETRQELLGLAEEYGFYILEDDPLSEITTLSSLKSQDIHDRVIYIKSLSNLLGPGLRIGFTLIPEEIREKIVRLKEINDLSTSGILQRIVYNMMRSGEMKRYIARLNKELQHRQAEACSLLGEGLYLPCIWIKTHAPSRVHMERLAGLGVRITPGDIYGARWANHLRICLMTPSGTDISRALEIIRKYMEGSMAPTISGMF